MAIKSAPMILRNVPRVRTLAAKEVLPAYKEEAEKYIRDTPEDYRDRVRGSLDVLNENSEGDLTGSNAFANILLQKVLPKTLRLATMADIGSALTENSEQEFSRGCYADTGVCFRAKANVSQSTEPLADRLERQLKKRNIILPTPQVIYSLGLSLRRNSNSEFGLVYDLTDSAEIIDAPELVSNGKFNRFSDKGIPILDVKGKRTSYPTSGSRLSRFGLDDDGNAGSGWGNLLSSNDSGRVVVVDAEGVAPAEIDTKRYISEIETKANEEVRRVEAIRNRAIAEINKSI